MARSHVRLAPFLRLAPLCAAMFFGFLTISLPLPALPLHVTRTLGFDVAIAGLAVGLQSFATLMTRPHAGRSVDEHGAKPTLVRGLIAAAAAGLSNVVSLLPGITPTLSLAILLAGRVVLGYGESLLITGVLSWAIERAGPGRAGRAMSWNGMAQYGALATGAPIGFALYGTAGFGVVALVATVAPLVALAVVLPLGAPPRPATRTRLRLTEVVRRIYVPGIALMMAGIGFSAVATFSSLLFVQRGWPGAGAALSAYGLCFVLVRVVAGGVPDRFGGRIAAAASMAVGCAGQLLLWMAVTPAVALAGAALTGAGCSLVFPSLGLEAFRRVPDESRGIAVGAFAAFQDLALGITGPVLGTVAVAYGASSVFLVGASMAAIGCILAFTLPPIARRERQHVS